MVEKTVDHHQNKSAELSRIFFLINVSGERSVRDFPATNETFRHRSHTPLLIINQKRTFTMVTCFTQALLKWFGMNNKFDSN